MRKTGNGNNKRKKIFITLAAVIAVAIAAMITVQIFSMRVKNNELKARKGRLEELLSEEELRKEFLENEAAYIQTWKYIEEKAKAIGYVYPDEIIFRKEE